MTLPSLLSDEDLNSLCSVAQNTPPGCFVEIGVYQGGSAERLYQIAQQQGRTLHLFDTFAGHPVVTEHDDTNNHPQGRFGNDAISPHVLQAKLPNAVIHIGTFPDTLPDDLRDIAFVHCDADLYAPTLAACTLLPPRMVNGAQMVFDDYRRTECPGVERAILEAFGRCDVLPTGKALVTVSHATT